MTRLTSSFFARLNKKSPVSLPGFSATTSPSPMLKMTAPPLKKPRLTCQTKRRHASELIARAAAMSHLEKNHDQFMLWVYHCSECKGWHLTSKGNGVKYMVTKDNAAFNW